VIDCREKRSCSAAPLASRLINCNVNPLSNWASDLSKYQLFSPAFPTCAENCGVHVYNCYARRCWDLLASTVVRSGAQSCALLPCIKSTWLNGRTETVVS